MKEMKIKRFQRCIPLDYKKTKRFACFLHSRIIVKEYEGSLPTDITKPIWNELDIDLMKKLKVAEKRGYVRFGNITMNNDKTETVWR